MNFVSVRNPLTVIAAVVALISSVALALPAFAQGTVASGTRSWNDWNFGYEVNGDFSGLSLTDLTYRGVPILGKASFPVMRVFYDDDNCGPYADRLGGTVYPVSWADNNLLVSRQFDYGGRTWLELGIQDVIGNYVIYQAWYLSTDGVIDGHIFSKGLQCAVDHRHYPYWRLDFDIAGADNDQVRRDTSSGWQTYGQEFSAPASAAVDHRWQVHDTNSGHNVDVQFTNTGWTDVPGPVEPETTYTNNEVFGCRYKASEDRGWRYGARSEVPCDDDAEAIDNQDIVLWYKGFLPHPVNPGDDQSELWHSSGVRLVVNLSDSSNNAPVVTNPGTQSGTEGDGVSLSIQGSDADGDPLSYSATNLPAGLSLNSENGLISGELATGSAGSYAVSIEVSDGSDSTTVNFTWEVRTAGGNSSTERFDFESSWQRWKRNSHGTDSATTGEWTRANPQQTVSNGRIMQLGDAASGQRAMVTGARAGSSVGANDIDGGVTSLRSKRLDLRGASSVSLSFSYYLAHLSNASSDDYFRVSVLGGGNSVVVFEQRGASSVRSAMWQTATADLSAFIGTRVRLLVEAADAGSGSLVEAGIDAIVVDVTR